MNSMNSKFDVSNDLLQETKKARFHPLKQITVSHLLCKMSARLYCHHLVSDETLACVQKFLKGDNVHYFAIDVVRW